MIQAAGEQQDEETGGDARGIRHPIEDVSRPPGDGPLVQLVQRAKSAADAEREPSLRGRLKQRNSQQISENGVGTEMCNFVGLARERNAYVGARVEGKDQRGPCDREQPRAARAAHESSASLRIA